MLIREIARVVVLAASGLGIGLALFSAGLNVRAFTRRRNRYQLAYALTRVGTAIVVFLVAKAIYRQPGIPVTGDVIAYTLGLLFISLGLVGVVLDQSRHKEER